MDSRNRCDDSDSRRDLIIQTARQYIGIPYYHHGRDKHGLDCIGLIVRVGRDLELAPASWLTFFDYSKYPNGTLLLQLRSHLHEISIDEAKPGSILCLRIRRVPQHVAFLSYNSRMIHSHQGQKEVREHSMGERWLNKIVAAFDFPQLVT